MRDRLQFPISEDELVYVTHFMMGPVWVFFFSFLFSSPVGDMSFKSALANGMWFSTLAELVLGERQLS